MPPLPSIAGMAPERVEAQGIKSYEPIRAEQRPRGVVHTGWDGDQTH